MGVPHSQIYTMVSYRFGHFYAMSSYIFLEIYTIPSYNMSMNNDLYYQYNPWWEDNFILPSITPREKFVGRLLESLQNDQVVLLTGLRRVGKTTLMKILIKHLLELGVKATHVFYISLDDYLLKEQNIPFMVPTEIIVALVFSKQLKKEEGLHALYKIKELVRKENYESALHALGGKP